ncbi:2-hydroxychromene-2-carboxylate isomerase [Marinobacter hydrocarbonoclasticus]|uniref:2-hydroxychromene-2-carboxylate isomerase n=1 Tax=Marinobacter nauticus TaxID=2743 RepID=UPI001C9531B8|nr:2-hydroxychromene-2-carboxylate isomerase [Marinobacter nauticus]MBY6192588.1 2-hydroxychromene-2-carboxylate isomerase [Marinobacter nauticus]MBY6213736.1 2-hydroxychromene-2-carboxylate isomerase [Marinobacter nauticus]
MSKTIDVYFDVGSPASYLAWTQLPALAARNSADINWKPMLLGGVFKATGNQSPITIPAKGRYTAVDLTRFAKEYGVQFEFNPHFPINTLQLMRGAAGYLHSPRFQDYLSTIFTALWVDKRNLNDPEVVSEVLIDTGFDPSEVLGLCNNPEVKEKLKQTTEEAISRGVFGAPTCFVESDMFFGQDRLDWVERALLSKE